MNNGDHPTSFESASEEDTKPAAEHRSSVAGGVNPKSPPHNSGSDNDSPEDSSSDDDEEGNNKSNEYITEDGRKLSEYEIQRLERIKRNQDYLAKLGLEGKDGGGVLGQKQKRRRTKRSSDASQVVRRSPLSRRTKIKKVVTYAEPSASVRDLLRVADRKASNAPVDLMISSPEKAELSSLVLPKPPLDHKKSRNRNVNERLEAFIYLEFKRIQSSKTQLAKQADRNVRLAEKEVKYWHKLVGRWERRNRKHFEAERQRQTEAKERVVLGGKSIKELLQDLDVRFPEIVAVAQRYDHCLQVCPWNHGIVELCSLVLFTASHCSRRNTLHRRRQHGRSTSSNCAGRRKKR